MSLYMIGIGLSDEKDISVKGLEAVRRCNLVYLEDYTSKLSVSSESLERFYGKKVILAGRELVEKRSDLILEKAKKEDVAFLIIGDVFSATTHIDLFLRAKEKNIDVKVIHNTSIMTAVGQVGLELYKYGKTTSMPFFEKSFMPESPYDAVKQNLKDGLHTLVLLDIKKDIERYMTVNVALEQFLELEKLKKGKIFSGKTMAIGCARLGSDDALIKYGTFDQLAKTDFGSPLHCLIIPGKLHFMEEEMLRLWK